MAQKINGPQRQTWRDVTDALRKIGLQQLVSDIEKVYETGKTLIGPVLLSVLQEVRQVDHIKCIHNNRQ